MRRQGGRRCGSPPLSAPLFTAYEACVAFDAKAQAWDEYTHTPLGRLRQELTMRYLAHYLGPFARGLDVLDVGGGTGSCALPLAQMGHDVCLLDFSAQMLDIARGRAAQLDPAAAARVSFCHASAVEIPSRFPADHFDLVLCHTLLEYLSEPWGILGTLAAVLRPEGTLSLLFANPRAEPLRWALVRGDLETARRALCGQTAAADLFGLPRRTFTAEGIQEALAREGLNVVAWYGVRTFADYMPPEELADPEFYARLLELEVAAGPLDPYRQVARYNLFLAEKSPSPEAMSPRAVCHEGHDNEG